MNTSKFLSLVLLASFVAGNVCAMEDAALNTAVDYVNQNTQQGWSEKAIEVFSNWKATALSSGSTVVSFAKNHPLYISAGIVGVLVTASGTYYLYQNGVTETAKQVKAKFPSLKTTLKMVTATAVVGGTAYGSYKGYQKGYFNKPLAKGQEYTSWGYGKLTNALKSASQYAPQMTRNRIVATGVGLTAVAASVAAYKYAVKPVENTPQQEIPVKKYNAPIGGWFSWIKGQKQQDVPAPAPKKEEPKKQAPKQKQPVQKTVINKKTILVNQLNAICNNSKLTTPDMVVKAIDPIRPLAKELNVDLALFQERMIKLVQNCSRLNKAHNNSGTYVTVKAVIQSIESFLQK